MADSGVGDVYGEDKTTLEQFITPWSFSVTSFSSLLCGNGYALLRDPCHNKGLAFSKAERDANERLFYKLLIDNVEELLLVVYMLAVGEAYQKGKILEVLKNWPERSIQVIVVTEGKRIQGLGDMSCQVYIFISCSYFAVILSPITIDVGTNNETLLNDEFYIGLKQRHATGEEYHDLLEEFMTAVKQNYGEKVLIQ
ncbi:hypothetical protein ABZP36_007649, partial [Zizania latifolia]